MVTDNPVTNDPSYLNLFKCGIIYLTGLMPRANKCAGQPKGTGIIRTCLRPKLIQMTATIQHFLTQRFEKQCE